MNYVTYTEMGEIVAVGTAPDFAETIMLASQPRIIKYETEEDVSTRSHMVDLSGTEPALVQRPDMNTVATLTNSGGVWNADGVDTITYGPGLPNPTHVAIRCSNPLFPDVELDVTDGILNLTTTAPGTYTIELTAFPYTDKLMVLEAV